MKIREIIAGEEIEICNLVARAFNEFIAPDFPEQGVEEFFLYANPSSFKRRIRKGYLAMVAECDGKLAGMIEIRSEDHISMLYVDKKFHRRGIARNLVIQALDKIIKNNSGLKDITVNSSRYAVPFYESLGFIQHDEEKFEYGVIHTPMMITRSNVSKIVK